MRRREREHHSRDDARYHRANWVKSLRNNGVRPEVAILESVSGEGETFWHESERFWIAYLKFIGCALTNCEHGGRGGVQLSEAQKLNLREKNTGKKLSEETRRKISEAGMGRKNSAECRAKISAANKGLKRSDETRKRMSDSAKNKIITPEHRKKMADARRGKALPVEWRNNISSANKGRKSPLKGRASPLKGRKQSAQHIEKRTASRFSKFNHSIN